MGEDKVTIGFSKTIYQDILQKAKKKKYKVWVDEDTVKEGT
jgi:hypothetical protein